MKKQEMIKQEMIKLQGIILDINKKLPYNQFIDISFERRCTVMFYGFSEKDFPNENFPIGRYIVNSFSDAVGLLTNMGFLNWDYKLGGKVWYKQFSPTENNFKPEVAQYKEQITKNFFDICFENDNLYKSKKECQLECDKLNDILKGVTNKK